MKSLIDHFDIAPSQVQSLVQETLHHADDGELYLEYTESEVLLFDNGQFKNGSFHQDMGFGLRVVAGEATGYAHSSELSAVALKRASEAAKAVTYNNHAGPYSITPQKQIKDFINHIIRLIPHHLKKKCTFTKIDAYLRAKNDKLHQVTVALSGSLQHVEILRADGHLVCDVRPLVRLSISVVAAEGNRRENGFYGCGGRQAFSKFIHEENWKHAADEALRMALINLDAEAAPAGTFDVVLANGWPGVMLHEAVGHGLEGDFNRKKLLLFLNF